MAKLLNTLYVTTEGSYLFCENEAIAVKIGGEVKVRLPAHTIETVVCFGNTTVSTPLIAFCGERGIGLVFLSKYGRFYGRVSGPVSGNVLLRRRQYKASEDPEFSVSFIRDLLSCKLINSRNMLLRSSREHPDVKAAEELKAAAAQLGELGEQLRTENCPETLRGIEGVAAGIYFGQFDRMLKTKSDELCFDVRSRHPPQNPVNAVLSFLYVLLASDIQSALETVGLDPAAGFLHAIRPGRPSLALDLMEELRAPLCDRLVLTLFNRGQLTPTDFKYNSGACTMSEEARRLIISSWQSRKKETILHPFLKEQIEIGLISHIQAKLLARVLRGDLDRYPPFVWR